MTKSDLRKLIKEVLVEVMEGVYLPAMGKAVEETVEVLVERKLKSTKTVVNEVYSDLRQDESDDFFGVPTKLPMINSRPLQRARSVEDIDSMLQGESVVDLFKGKDFSSILKKSIEKSTKKT